ncbi:ribosome maturation factor RimM [Pararhodospirillum oryzae]|uniref:Ribosome maturation factor RimM n=1 Tax=Pararhodospirillum oryzae TaxID=478448 RepID=A0A512H9H3_9PROT|nr:ribosome maturation factor RimM [Pararhodospirillum oryzae]GEO82104.1 ribosome maturation factor RimM [Pararhodospirillum oryzae]
MTKRMLVGVIVGVHGVKGLVRVKAFVDDEATLETLGPLSDEDGRRSFRLAVRNRVKGVVLCAIEGISDRTAAEALKGTRLFLDRALLPRETLDEDEFFLGDLVGLSVRRTDGSVLGRIAAVPDYGAGVLLDVLLADGRRSVVLPFTRAVVPVVDLKAGHVVVDPPPGLLDEGARAPLDDEGAPAPLAEDHP